MGNSLADQRALAHWVDNLTDADDEAVMAAAAEMLAGLIAMMVLVVDDEDREFLRQTAQPLIGQLTRRGMRAKVRGSA